MPDNPKPQPKPQPNPNADLELQVQAAAADLEREAAASYTNARYLWILSIVFMVGITAAATLKRRG